MRNYCTKKELGICLTSFLLIFNLACEDFMEVDGPSGQLSANEVFEDEATATAAITTLYAKLRDDTLLTGNGSGLNVLLGFYSDELDYYSFPGSSLEAVYNHQIIASNDQVKTLWDTSYKLIYMCNSALERLEGSQTLSNTAKNQLIGEALFIRALTHFYLVNLFGDVPYVTSTDFIVNQDVTKIPGDEVNDLIVTDLVTAKSMLTDNYISGERTRANTYVAAALLSRLYLYNQEWEKAETESSLVINATAMYHLEDDLNDEFVINSASGILQLKPKLDGENTKEAGVFLFEYGPPLNASLNTLFVNSFEMGDLRRENWIKEVTDGSETWYMPYKYKAQEYTGNTVEYSIVFRLAEQILIRAEARAHLGDFVGSKMDIDTIRFRAGLSASENNTFTTILQSIVQERKHELFTEQGHRWFDLKRLDIADSILEPLKSNWRATDILFPIPETELRTNPNLAPQNPGY